MKKFLNLLLITGLMLLGNGAHAAPIIKAPFEKVIYLNAAISSTNSPLYSGVDYTNAKGFYDGDLWNIPAGAVIEQMYIIVDTAVSGITLFELGDDDDANDFIASSSTPFTYNNATTGIMYADLAYKGNYLKSPYNTSVYNPKYYSASGKELKLNVTGTATAGKVRVVVKGYIVGA